MHCPSDVEGFARLAVDLVDDVRAFHGLKHPVLEREKFSDLVGALEGHVEVDLWEELGHVRLQSFRVTLGLLTDIGQHDEPCQAASSNRRLLLYSTTNLC